MTARPFRNLIVTAPCCALVSGHSLREEVITNLREDNEFSVSSLRMNDELLGQVCFPQCDLGAEWTLQISAAARRVGLSLLPTLLPKPHLRALHLQILFRS